MMKIVKIGWELFWGVGTGWGIYWNCLCPSFSMKCFLSRRWFLNWNFTTKLGMFKGDHKFQWQIIISISPWLVWCVFQASVFWFLLHELSLLFDIPLQMSSPHEYWNQSSPDMPVMSMDKFFQAMDTKADDNKDNSLEVSFSEIIHFSFFCFFTIPRWIYCLLCI